MCIDYKGVAAADNFKSTWLAYLLNWDSGVLNKKMKYSLQLLYIVLAIYLTFVAWIVNADPVCHTLLICYLSKTCLFYFSVLVFVEVLVAQETPLAVCWFFMKHLPYMNIVFLTILNYSDHIHVVDIVLF